MAKRGSRKPEKASTKPPAQPKSSFPRKDPRPPKRGRKPKDKPAPKESMKALEKRTLSDAETLVVAKRSARLALEADARETRLRAAGADERKAIKSLRAQSAELNQQVALGFEFVPQGDLFADKTTHESRAIEAAGSKTPTPGQAAQALSEAAKHVAAVGKGNGEEKGPFEFGADEPAPKIDPVVPAGLRIVPAPAVEGGGEPMDDIDRAAADATASLR